MKKERPPPGRVQDEKEENGTGRLRSAKSIARAIRRSNSGITVAKANNYTTGNCWQ